MPKPKSHPMIWRIVPGRRVAQTTDTAEAQRARAERKAAIHRGAMRMRAEGRMPERVPCRDCGGESPDMALCHTCGMVGTVLAA